MKHVWLAVLGFLKWLWDSLYRWILDQISKEESKEDSKKIDEADDHIKDVPINPKDRKDTDIFDNEGWNKK